MSDNKFVSNNDLYLSSVLETSRVVNHDLLGVIHVIDFCIDELSIQDNNQSNPYVDRIGKSVDQLKSIIENHGNFIKSVDSRESNGVYLKNTLEQITKQLKIVNRRISEKILFEIPEGEIPDNFMIQKSLRSCLYGLLSVVIKSHFKESLNQKIKITITSNESHLNLKVSGNVLGEQLLKKLESLSEESALVFKEEHFLKKCMSLYGNTCLNISDSAGFLNATIDLDKFKYDQSN